MVRSSNTNSQILHRVNKLQTYYTKCQWFAHWVKTRTNPQAQGYRFFLFLLNLTSYSIPKSVLTDCIYFLFSNQYSQSRFVNCTVVLQFQWMNECYWKRGAVECDCFSPVDVAWYTWRVMRRMTSPLGFIDIINYSIFIEGHHGTLVSIASPSDAP